MKELEKRKKEVGIISAVALVVLIIVIICMAVSCQHKDGAVEIMETIVPAETIEQEETTAPTELEETTEPEETEDPEEETTAPESTEAPSKPNAGNNGGNTSNKPTPPAKPATKPSKPENKPVAPPKPETPKPTQPPVTEPPAPPAPTECPHNWKTVNHPEEGHTQALCVCDCGKTFKTIADWNAHVEAILAGPNPTDAVLYHGGWYNSSEWIVDKPAWSETICSLCGAHK